MESSATMEINLEKIAFDINFHPSSALITTGLISGDLHLLQCRAVRRGFIMVQRLSRNEVIYSRRKLSNTNEGEVWYGGKFISELENCYGVRYLAIFKIWDHQRSQGVEVNEIYF
ncbi:hypothetical protein FRX31_032394 [Thalictrum thalictroides]|uniref:Uncharacterized protein n=1 Tax=Thalictrum thalictroides TaxID=46969 RepID=A0A7J6UZF6_THATH|nr:hypothetical protein FRX31_032394 [Thalictrum thalictroides]